LRGKPVRDFVGIFVCFLLVLSQGSVAVAQKCSAVELSFAETPAPPFFLVSLYRYLEQQKEIPSIQPDVVLIGDSLVAAWNAIDAERAFGTKTLFNFGVGGDRTQNVLWRLPALQNLRSQPKLAALLIGTNNLWTGGHSCSIAEGILSIVKELKTLWPNTSILVIGIPPRAENPKIPPRSREEINDILAKTAASIGYDFFSTDEALSCSSFPCDKFQSDGLHLSGRGYQLLSDAIRLHLKVGQH